MKNGDDDDVAYVLYDNLNYLQYLETVYYDSAFIDQPLNMT